jgi:hypothetical protein
MPQVRYAVLGDDGERAGTEDLRCAPGPMGWRSFSEIETDDPTPHREIVDVAVDRDWRIARVRIDTGEHDLLLEARDDVLTGFRDRRPIEIAWNRDLHLDYFTPTTNAITTRRLGGTEEIEVVYLEPFTLEPSRVRQRYELLGNDEVDTAAGPFAAVRWRFTSLDSGWTADLWVAGDVGREPPAAPRMTEAGPKAGFRTGMLGVAVSGNLVGLHVDHEIDLLADEESTGLDRDVPRQVPVLALDARLGLGGEVGVAERIRAPPEELPGEGDRLRDVTDREVAVELEARSAEVTHRGAPERHHGVLLHLEEIRALQVGVALIEIGLHAARLDLDLDARRLRGVADLDRARELGEAAAGLGEQVLRHEPHLGVADIQLIRACGRKRDAVDLPCCHGHDRTSCSSLAAPRGDVHSC